MTKSGRVLSGKPVVFSIPIDFCIEFWNSTFSPVLEFTEGIFLTASARAFQWCKPRMRSCFRSKVIQVFLEANSTWTYYSPANIRQEEKRKKKKNRMKKKMKRKKSVD